MGGWTNVVPRVTKDTSTGPVWEGSARDDTPRQGDSHMLTKRLSLPLIALALALAAPAAAGAATPIAGQYIVVLKGGEHGSAVAAEHARSAGARVLHTYDSALQGYAAKLSDAGLAKVKADPRVASVTQDASGSPVLGQMLP